MAAPLIEDKLGLGCFEDDNGDTFELHVSKEDGE